MDLEAKGVDVRTPFLELTCPRCREASVPYWPVYDEPGDIVSCSACQSLYELTDTRAGKIAPFDPGTEGAAPTEEEPCLLASRRY